MGGLAKFGLDVSHNRHNTVAAAEVAEQELATARLGQREQRAGVHGAQVVQILVAGRQPEQSLRLGGSLEAQERVEGKLGDAVLHAAWWAFRGRCPIPKPPAPAFI